MGLTSNLVTGTWVGGDDRSIHFRSGAYGEGSKTALPIFGRYMTKVVNDPSLEAYHPIPFEKLDPKRVTKEFNCTAVYVPRNDTLYYDSTFVGSDSIAAPVNPAPTEAKPDTSKKQ
jgi:penicillin-binding protein 1A